MERFCGSFSGSVGRSLWIWSGDWKANLCTEAIHWSPRARRACQLLVIPLNSEVLKRPQTWFVAFFNLFFFSLFLPGLASLFSATPLPSPVFLLRCPQQPQQLVPEWREQAGLPRCQAIVTERFTLLSGPREPHREIGFSDNLLIQAIHSSSPSLPFWRGLFLLVPQEPVPETPLPHLWRPLFTNSTL